MVSYRVDQHDFIVEVGGAWDEFAAANRGMPPVVGRRLWHFVAGADVRAVWALLLRRVRTTGEPLAFLYRCDAPGLRRLMQMQLLPERDGSVRFHSTQVRALPGPTFNGRWEAGTTHPATTVCGWCARVEDEGVWVAPETALQRLGLGEGQAVRLTHGICVTCAAELRSLALS